MKRLMDAYCSKVGKSLEAVRFVFDGKIMAQDATPNDLGMRNDDVINVYS